jgi:predicted Zn finger-like uncharacterized protein
LSTPSDAELRYTFTCPNCSGSFSIGLDRIPPVKARFSCPRCGTAMDFPSREEARIYMLVQTRNQAGGDSLVDADAAASDPSPRAAAQTVSPAQNFSRPQPAAPPPPVRLQAAAPPARPVARTAAPPPPAASDKKEQSYVVQKTGFEGDTFDRRGVRVLIRTGALNPVDSVSIDGAAAVRADQVQELKSLFELRKTAKVTPPAVCPKHLDRVAYYLCASSRRPLCEECAQEKKFGGASVRVCDHCAGNVEEIPVPNE